MFENEMTGNLDKPEHMDRSIILSWTCFPKVCNARTHDQKQYLSLNHEYSAQSLFYVGDAPFQAFKVAGKK